MTVTLLLTQLSAAASDAATAAATDADDGAAGPHLHGPVEFLQQSLVQSQEAARLVDAAKRQIDNGDLELAFQALLQVFAQPHDAFTPVFPGRPSVSTYHSAFELLRQADYRVRVAWNTATGPLAREALEQALDSGDTGRLQVVARRFPLTESGMQALAAQAVLAATLGQPELGQAVLAELESVYGPEPAVFPVSGTLQALKHRLRLERDADAPASTVRMAGTGQRKPPAALGLPWPEPLWHWQESVWDHPQATGTMAGLTLPANRSLLSVNSWQPTLTADSVILRTPLHVIAFDKLSGNRLWSVATDTEDPVQGLRHSAEPFSFGTRSSARDLLMMDDFGSVVVAGEMLYFIDHFRVFRRQYPSLDRGNFRFGPLPGMNSDPAMEKVSDGGTRLVAVRLTPSPSVAWTVGDAADFDYQFLFSDDADSLHGSLAVAGQSPPSPEEEDTDQTTVASPFADQHFMGVPLLHRQMLFVLSADEEMIWLNCLTASRGQLLWKRPVLYRNEPESGPRGRFIVVNDAVAGASLCGVDGDIVLSALKNGVVVGTRLLDGQFQWATNLRDEPGSNLSRGGGSYGTTQSTADGVTFAPVLSPGRMVWAAPQGDSVHCLDTQTGAILWKVDRAVEGEGATEGSVDNYAVHISDDAVVMIGERHARALDLATGAQRWVTSLQRQTGRAACNGKTCLVPLQDGSLATLSVQAGERGVATRDVFGTTRHSLVGTVTADDDVLCVSTPISVTVLPTAAAMRSEPEGPAAADASDPSRILSQARSQLLSGNREAAVLLLKRLLPSVSDSDSHREAAGLLGQTLLRQLARLRFHPDRPDAAEVAAMSEDASDVLNQLPLNAEQRLRHRLLAPRNATVTLPPEPVPPLLDMLPEWRVRADLAAWTLLPSEDASAIASFHDSAKTQLQRIEHAILFPRHVGDTAEQIAFARTLVSDYRDAAAELFLLAALRDAADEDRGQLIEQVRQIRGITADRRLPAEPDLTGDNDVTIDETLMLDTDNRIVEILLAAKAAVETPDWFSDRLFLVNRNLFSVNLQTGAVSPPRRLPGSVDAVRPENNFETPGLIPFADTSHVGALSLSSPGSPEVLWFRQVPREDSDMSPLEIGSLGPGHLVVATSSQLMCLHPLTGRLLWQRELTAGRPHTSLFQQTVRLCGDHRVIGVLGQNLQTCEVFRTLDGQKLDTVSLDIPPMQIPIVSGRRILFQRDQQLVLTDLLTGQNLLETRPRLAVFAAGQARLLSDHRVVVIDEDLNLVVLNLQTADTELQCSVSELLDRQRLTGLNAFERNGCLFVLVKDWGNPRSQLSASSRMGDMRLDSGTLFCIDLRTGNLRWHRPGVPAVMPAIYGDPTSLIVTWSWENPASQLWQRQIGRLRENQENAELNAQRSLIVRLVSGETGQTIAEQRHLSPLEPVRCVHDESADTVTIETERSDIVIRYREN